MECGNDAAARCLYAEWLMVQPQPDDREQARSLFASIIDDAQHWSRHARSHNAVWLDRTKAALKATDAWQPLAILSHLPRSQPRRANADTRQACTTDMANSLQRNAPASLRRMQRF